MDIETRLKKLEDYCFIQNSNFQDNVFNNVLQKIESEGMGFGQRLAKEEPFVIKIRSKNKGFGLPILTTTQRANIVAPTEGLMIFNDTTKEVNWYDGTRWNADQDNQSGTYLPILTAVNNVTATTSRLATWLKVGNTVTVAGQMDVNSTGNAQTKVGISLPIASNFTTAYQAGGTANSPLTNVGHNAGIYADAVNDRAQMEFNNTGGAGNDTFCYTFTYQIL